MIFNIGGHAKTVSGSFDGEGTVKQETGGNWSWTVTSGRNSIFIPDRDMIVDIFVCGGGGGGGNGNNGSDTVGGIVLPDYTNTNISYATATTTYIYGGGGGAGGYFATARNVKLYAGRRYKLTVGEGGAAEEDGGTTSFSYGSDTILYAMGGEAGSAHNPGKEGACKGGWSGAYGNYTDTASSAYWSGVGIRGDSAKHTLTSDSFEPTSFYAFGDSEFGDKILYGGGGAGGSGWKVFSGSSYEITDLCAYAPSCCIWLSKPPNDTDYYDVKNTKEKQTLYSSGGATGGGLGGGFNYYLQSSNHRWYKDEENDSDDNVNPKGRLKGHDGIANTGGGGGGGGFFLGFNRSTTIETYHLSWSDDDVYNEYYGAEGGKGGSGVIILRNARGE